MEEYSDSRGGRCKKFRRILIFLIVSLVMLYGTAFLRFWKGRTVVEGISAAVPVASSEAFASFLESNGVEFRSAENQLLQLDHYNPERLTVAELRFRFLPDDDRLTPFLKALPELYDIERNGEKLRRFFPTEPLSVALVDQWETARQDSKIVFGSGRKTSSAFWIFFYCICAVCFVLTTVIQRKAGKALVYAAAVFPAVVLSGSIAVLWATIFILNLFLSLWRKWAPHFEYRLATGVNTVSRRDAIRIGGEAVAAVLCAVLPPAFIPGERLAVAVGIATAAAGVFAAAAAFERGDARLRRSRLLFKPLLGSAFRLPLKAAVGELVLGVLLLLLPIAFTLFSRLPSKTPAGFEGDFFLPDSSYEAVYEQSLRQPRGKLNAVGYLEEKVFQYCYRYQKVPRLPQPQTEIFITEYFYENGEIQSEKITAEIFTERGFGSIIKKSQTDPLSTCFLQQRQTSRHQVSIGGCLLWIFFSVFYFLLLIPFFRFPANVLRRFGIKGKS